MGLIESAAKRRLAVITNYGFLLLTLAMGLAARSLGWTLSTIVCFWLSVVVVLVTFYPLHIRTGLWRLAHTRVDRMDEREIHQTLGALRHAYIVFSISALTVILIALILDLGGQSTQLVIFWVLLYLAHSLPSSILAWTATRVPTQIEE